MFIFPGSPMAVGNSLPPATLVGATSVAPNGSGVAAVAFPPGTAAGDLAIIAVGYEAAGIPSSITGGSGGAWTRSGLTWYSGNYFASLHQRVLSAGDLAGVTVNGAYASPVMIIVYRGPTLATVKSSNPLQSDDKLTLTGFAKSSTCRGLVTLTFDRDAGSVPTAPASFARRVAASYVYFAGAIADKLSFNSYVNGATVEWTDFLTASGQMGWLLELT